MLLALLVFVDRVGVVVGVIIADDLLGVDVVQFAFFC